MVGVLRVVGNDEDVDSYYDMKYHQPEVSSLYRHLTPRPDSNVFFLGGIDKTEKVYLPDVMTSNPQIYRY